MSHVQVLGSCLGWVVAPMPSFDPCSVTSCHRAIPQSLFPIPPDQSLFESYGSADKNSFHRVATQWSSSWSTKTSPRLNPPEPKSSANSPMGKPPSIDTIRAVVSGEIHNATIVTIRPVPATSPRRFYNITLSDGRCLALNLSPLTTTRLFRSEHALAQSEVTVVQWLTSTTLDCPEESVHQQQHPSPAPTNSTTLQRSRDSSLCPTQSQQSLLARVLPSVIHHTTSVEKLGTPFNLFETDQSRPISSLDRRLSQTERDSINFDNGHLVRSLASLVSPTSKFGTALTILHPAPSPPSSPPPSWSQNPLSSQDGVQGWKEAFHAMFERALRDGEDMGVTITYSRIRNHFRRLSHVLDRVTQARLVILHHDPDENILVGDSSEEGRPAVVGGGNSASCKVRLAGLQDWSNCVFADPLLAVEFSQETSTRFLHGFGIVPGSPLWHKLSQHHDLPTETILRSITQEEDDYSSSASSSSSHSTLSELIEDPTSAHIRLLLYECYHAVIDLVRQFYRPSKTSDREMAARRRLTKVLRRLEETSEVLPVAPNPVKVKEEIKSPRRTTLSPRSPRAADGHESLADHTSHKKEGITVKTEKDGDVEEVRIISSSSSDSEIDDKASEAKRSRRPSVDGPTRRPQKRPKSMPSTPLKEEEDKDE